MIRRIIANHYIAVNTSSLSKWVFHCPPPTHRIIVPVAVIGQAAAGFDGLGAEAVAGQVGGDAGGGQGLAEGVVGVAGGFAGGGIGEEDDVAVAVVVEPERNR